MMLATKPELKVWVRGADSPRWAGREKNDVMEGLEVSNPAPSAASRFSSGYKGVLVAKRGKKTNVYAPLVAFRIRPPGKESAEANIKASLQRIMT